MLRCFSAMLSNKLVDRGRSLLADTYTKKHRAIVLPTAYSNGKSAVRLQPGVVPSGCHRFRSLPHVRKLVSRWVTPCIERYAEELGESCIGGGSSVPIAMPHPCLFHFVNCNFNVRKHPLACCH